MENAVRHESANQKLGIGLADATLEMQNVNADHLLVYRRVATNVHVLLRLSGLLYHQPQPRARCDIDQRIEAE